MIWKNMKQRCFNKNNPRYKDYGGRGITVCEEWKTDASLFILWAFKNGYAETLEIDRINNEGDYNPRNCRFVTTKENCRNTRKNKILKFNNKSLTLSEWSELTGINRTTISSRLKRGWDIKIALTKNPKEG
jgi:hypothetical protein